jgi:hypothetical protein
MTDLTHPARQGSVHATGKLRVLQKYSHLFIYKVQAFLKEKSIENGKIISRKSTLHQCRAHLSSLRS